MFGELGGLPGPLDNEEWIQGQHALRTYGIEMNESAIRVAASRIEVIGENRKEREKLDRTTARGCFADTDCVCFLGFGYHSSNLDLLRIDQIPAKVSFIGTAYGVSAERKREIERTFSGRNRRIALGEAREDIIMFLRNPKYGLGPVR
jgi:hypothetical protein